MMLLLAAPPATGPGSFLTYISLAAAALAPVIAGLQALANRRTKAERDAAVAQVKAQAGQAEAQGAVIATGDPIAWRATDHQALIEERGYTEKLGRELREAQGKLRNALDLIAEQDRKIDALSENIRQLRLSISACPGGPHCPLGPVGDES